MEENDFSGKKIIPFGAGIRFQILDTTDFVQLVDNIPYLIDNSTTIKEVNFAGRLIPVFSVKKILEESDCIILITPKINMFEMYCQLENMKLSNDIELYFLAFIQQYTDAPVLEKMFGDNYISEKRIPKIIHSFWFSGDKKTQLYQKCIESWKSICPDYEIIEWNKDNYDYTKNNFCKSAIENGAWAFASDYARLDVVHKMGGIYLDMDVLLKQNLDPFLGNEAVFAFGALLVIDLMVFMAQKDSDVVGQILKLYDNIEVP